MSGRLIRVESWEHLAKQARFQPAELAGICTISLRQLERFFDEQFHRTPSQWLRELQCHLAKQLILRGYSNKAVVIELHFASESHFCREFKKQFGASPRTFLPMPGRGELDVAFKSSSTSA